MKKIARYIAMAVMAGGCLAGYAQNAALTKEITVETDFVPEVHKATKLNILPTVAKSMKENAKLDYSEWDGEIELPLMIKKYDAYCYNGERNYAETRGYVNAGVGTQMNIVGNVGYRIVDSDDMVVKAWVQHLSTWMGKNSSALVQGDAQKQKVNDNVVGVDFAKMFAKGVLTAKAYYHYDGFNYYGVKPEQAVMNEENQGVNEVDVSVGWQNKRDNESGIRVWGDVKFNHIGFANGEYEKAKGMKENIFEMKAKVEAPMNKMGVGAEASWVHVDDRDMNVWDVNYYNKRYSMFTVVPFVKYSTERLRLQLGVNLDISANDGAALRFAPRVNASYTIANVVSLDVDVNGGKKVNTMSDFHAMCRYVNPSRDINTSYSPIDGKVALKIGAIAGAYVKPYFAYGVFDDECVLWGLTATPYVNTSKINMKGWAAGAEAGYKCGEVVNLTASVQYAPQDNETGYRTGLDRAEWVVNARVKVRPMKKLDVTVGYEGRNNRAYYSEVLDVNEDIRTFSRMKLGNVANVWVNAYYRLNDKTGVWVNANNVLNKQWDDCVGMGAQKLNAMAGVTYVF